MAEDILKANPNLKQGLTFEKAAVSIYLYLVFSLALRAPRRSVRISGMYDRTSTSVLALALDEKKPCFKGLGRHKMVP